MINIRDLGKENEYKWEIEKENQSKYESSLLVNCTNTGYQCSLLLHALLPLSTWKRIWTN